MKILPKAQQPKGGYKHPRHLKAIGPKHRAWSIGRGWYESCSYCIAPSHSLYNAKLVND